MLYYSVELFQWKSAPDRSGPASERSYGRCWVRHRLNIVLIHILNTAILISLDDLQ